MNEELEDRLKSDDFVTPKLGEQGIVILPKELEGAPDDVKSFYLKWLQLGEAIKMNKRRYFQFVNSVSGELEQVDAMQISGMAVRQAQKKNVDKADLPRLKDVCREMESLKKQKTSMKMKWLAYVRPRMGKDVFDWRKAEIVDMFAKFAGFDEVKKNLEEMGYMVDASHIYKFFLNNRDIIDKKRTEFIRSAKDHYLATDAGRMETLAMLHTRFLQLFNEVYTSTNPNKEQLTALSREIRAIVEQARKEIKGEELKLTVDGKIDINASLQAAATIQDISKKLPINIIPIYLVAVKQGINPNNLLASLVGSFYKSFNGFGALAPKGMTPPTTMDLIRNYDWNEIQQHHANKPTVETETVDYEEMPFTEKAKVLTQREKLLDLINKQSNEKPV